MHFRIQIEAPSGFIRITALVTLNGDIEDPFFEYQPAEREKEFTIKELILYFEEFHIDQEVFIVIELIDAFDEPTFLEIPVTIFTSDLLVLSDWQIEASGSDGFSRSFLASQNGIRNSSNSIKVYIPEFSDQVDMGYYYGTIGMASLASPIAYETMDNESTSENSFLQSHVEGWPKINTTTFKNTSLSRDDFFLIATVDDLNQIFDNGTDPTTVKTNLKINDILVFETDSDKLIGSDRGLILVEDIVDGDSNGESNGSEDYIVINMVVTR